MQAKNVTDIIQNVLKKFMEKANGDAEKEFLISNINNALCRMVRTDWKSAEVDKMELGEVESDYEPKEKYAVNHVANHLDDLLRHLLDVQRVSEKAEIVEEDLDALYWAVAILRGIEE